MEMNAQYLLKTYNVCMYVYVCTTILAAKEEEIKKKHRIKSFVFLVGFHISYLTGMQIEINENHRQQSNRSQIEQKTQTKENDG